MFKKSLNVIASKSDMLFSLSEVPGISPKAIGSKAPTWVESLSELDVFAPKSFTFSHDIAKRVKMPNNKICFFITLLILLIYCYICMHFKIHSVIPRSSAGEISVGFSFEHKSNANAANIAYIYFSVNKGSKFR